MGGDDNVGAPRDGWILRRIRNLDPCTSTILFAI